MAIWTKPPREQYDLFVEYMQEQYPTTSISTACGADKKLIHFEIPSMSDEDFNVLLNIVKEKFPQIF